MCTLILTKVLISCLRMGLNVPTGSFLLGARGGLFLWPANPEFVPTLWAVKWSQSLMKRTREVGVLEENQVLSACINLKVQCPISELFKAGRHLDLKNKRPKREKRMRWWYQSCFNVKRGNLRSVLQGQWARENTWKGIVSVFFDMQYYISFSYTT